MTDDLNNPMHPRLDLMDEQELIGEGNRRQTFWLNLGTSATSAETRQRITDLADWVIAPRRELDKRRAGTRLPWNTDG